MGNPNDWDFLIGDWRVRHRRLRKRLSDCTDWDEFDGTCSSKKVLGGAGNVDDNALDFPGGAFRAVTLRAYDAATDRWSIWWLDSRSPSQLDPPLVGRFENGVGIFFADHVFEGRPVRVRFRWTGMDSGSPRWEQAFSADGGDEWEINWTMEFTKGGEQTTTNCCPVVELRQYTLHPGMRDRLIDLFEREFVESQEEVGMRIIGTFRDLDNPDRFVWLRGFEDMASRGAQLAQFYGGLVWKAHREAANATMIDSDNVLLLRPAAAESGFDLAGCDRAAGSSTGTTTGLIVATIYQASNEQQFAEFFKEEIVPRLREAGIPVLASFVTEHHPNTFPALPVREESNVFVWFTRSVSRAEYERRIPEEVLVRIRGRIETDPEVLFLEPTRRSLLCSPLGAMIR